jgi:hypothetical protein
MAIEIKELRIKVTITEPSEFNKGQQQKFSPEKLQEWRSEIIKECTRTVLEKIKERAER